MLYLLRCETLVWTRQGSDLVRGRRIVRPGCVQGGGMLQQEEVDNLVKRHKETLTTRLQQCWQAGAEDEDLASSRVCRGRSIR